MDFKQEKIYFSAYNLKLAGLLNIPQTEKVNQFPAIVCTHPTSSCKDQTAGKYAERLAEAGFVTLLVRLEFVRAAVLR